MWSGNDSTKATYLTLSPAALLYGSYIVVDKSLNGAKAWSSNHHMHRYILWQRKVFSLVVCDGNHGGSHYFHFCSIPFHSIPGFVQFFSVHLKHKFMCMTEYNN